MSARVRPTRSARNPNSSPPIAEARSVSEFSRPALPLSIPRSRIRCASTIEYSITSIASSIQPSPPATSERRSAWLTRSGHSSPSTRRVPRGTPEAVSDIAATIATKATDHG